MVVRVVAGGDWSTRTTSRRLHPALVALRDQVVVLCDGGVVWCNQVVAGDDPNH